jgi:hypothetical protein
MIYLVAAFGLYVLVVMASLYSVSSPAEEGGGGGAGVNWCPYACVI